MTARGREDLWALILAGGDGTRLQGLTHLISGAPIPKQYCRILGDRSLLEATLDRVGCLVPVERTLVIANRAHLAVAGGQLGGLPPANLLIQPRNRDTGPGMMLALRALALRDPDAAVAVFPSDHFVRDVAAFRASLARMAEVVAAAPAKIALLGIRPDRADAGLGYILPAAAPVHLALTGALAVRGFEEKPAPSRAAAIVDSGGLWSAFIMMFRVQRMLDVVAGLRIDPAPVAQGARGPRAEGGGERRAQARTLGPSGPRTLLPGDDRVAWNFSRDVLERIPHELLVVEADDFGWSDLGTPDAVAQVIARLGLRPHWLRASQRLGNRIALAASQAS